MHYVGIIGCGKVAQVRHIPEYASRPDVEIVGYFDTNLKRAETLAGSFGGSVFTSWERMLAIPEITAVSVCTPNSTHAEITIAALTAGKDVLCEKPMAVTLDECERMTATARECGRVLFIGQNQRLTRAHERARDLIADGMIGKIVGFRTLFGHSGPESWSIDPGAGTWFFDRSQAAMGVMADLGIHKTDLIHFLTGQNVVRTTARLVTVDKRDQEGALIGVDDNAVCIYELAGGAIGTMTASWTHYASEDNSTVIYGTEGELRIYDDPAFTVKVLLKSGEKLFFETDPIQTNDNQTASGVIDCFIDTLNGERGRAIYGEDVLRAMRVVFASIKSAESLTSVTIKHD